MRPQRSAKRTPGSHWKPLEYLGITMNHLTSAMQSTSTISEKSHPTPQRPAGLPAHSRRMLLLWYLWLARLTPEAQESDLQIPPMCSLALRLPVQSAGMNVTYDIFMILIYYNILWHRSATIVQLGHLLCILLGRWTWLHHIAKAVIAKVGPIDCPPSFSWKTRWAPDWRGTRKHPLPLSSGLSSCVHWRPQ